MAAEFTVITHTRFKIPVAAPCVIIFAITQAFVLAGYTVDNRFIVRRVVDVESRTFQS